MGHSLLYYDLSLLIKPSFPKGGVSIMTVMSVRSFESSLLLRKFSSRTRFVRGPLLSRIGAFQSNHAVNPFCQLFASVIDISRLRFTFGLNVFS